MSVEAVQHTCYSSANKHLLGQKEQSLGLVVIGRGKGLVCAAKEPRLASSSNELPRSGIATTECSRAALGCKRTNISSIVVDDVADGGSLVLFEEGDEGERRSLEEQCAEM